MSNNQNDVTMLLASQLAYVNVDFVDKKNVGELIDYILTEYGELNEGDTVSIHDADLYQTACKFKELADTYDVDWEKWEIIDVCNDQDDTGYYGMMIKTGEGEAIVANRGTELNGLDNIYKDLVLADVGLLDSTCTNQQATAEKYMEELWYKYGDEYNYNVTGHSLGGNLAQHMTIHAPTAMRDHISHCKSFDGPGFSDEYIEKNRELIDKMSGKMDWYQWSFISSLLNPLPGVNTVIIEAKDTSDPIKRHGMDMVILDDKGNVKEGDEYWLSKITGPITRDIDSPEFKDWFLFALSQVNGVPDFLGLIVGLKLFKSKLFLAMEVKAAVEEIWTSVKYSFFRTQVSGEFEVETKNLSLSMTELLKIVKYMEDIRMEAENLVKSIQYDSMAGAYYRSALRIGLCNLSVQLDNLKELASVLDDIAELYDNADNKVSELF